MRYYSLTAFLSLATGILAVDPLVNLDYASYQGQTLQNGVNQWLAVRFAAPPTGALRFAAPQAPLKENSTQDATKEGALCVSANNVEGLQFGSARQPMAEDCLFMGIYAPANATEASKLPIMFFISGGGFTSNSNGNFNGTGLVERSGMNMMVVRINYRVGILGFIAGTEITNNKNGAVPNNGLNDMIAAARWVKQYASKFGGDPDHIVLSGDSSGGNAIDILLTANNGTGFPDLFVGAMAESTGWGSDPQAVDRDTEFANNVNSTGCLNAPDAIECMKALPIDEFQNKTTKDGWGPTIDGVFLVAPHYQMMEQGRFQKIPVIYGSASNEGTPNFISNQSATTDDDIANHIKSSVGPSLTDERLAAMMAAYPTSLNEVSFFNRNMTARNATLREGSGPQWQRDAAVLTELKLQCVSAFFSDMNSMVGNTANYHYRYNVLDTTPGGLADTGIFTPHTSELYAIWGNNNTDGGDPKCFTIPTADGGCSEAINIVSSYWISFVRTLNPNTFKAAGAPDWQPWSIASPQRIVFDNGAATMETMGSGIDEITIADLNQRQRCNVLTLPLAKAINIGLIEGESLPPFANGTASDPTLSVTSSNTTNTTSVSTADDLTNGAVTITVPSGNTISSSTGNSNSKGGNPNTNTPLVINGSDIVTANGTLVSGNANGKGGDPGLTITLGSGTQSTSSGGAIISTNGKSGGNGNENDDGNGDGTTPILEPPNSTVSVNGSDVVDGNGIVISGNGEDGDPGLTITLGGGTSGNRNGNGGVNVSTGDSGGNGTGTGTSSSGASKGNETSSSSSGGGGNGTTKGSANSTSTSGSTSAKATGGVEGIIYGKSCGVSIFVGVMIALGGALVLF